MAITCNPIGEGGIVIRFDCSAAYHQCGESNFSYITFSDAEGTTGINIPQIDFTPTNGIIELRLPVENLTPDNYVPTASGIYLEIGLGTPDNCEVYYYIRYSPTKSNITLNSDVLDISKGGWYYLNF